MTALLESIWYVEHMHIIIIAILQLLANNGQCEHARNDYHLNSTNAVLPL